MFRHIVSFRNGRAAEFYFKNNCAPIHSQTIEGNAVILLTLTPINLLEMGDIEGEARGYPDFMELVSNQQGNQRRLPYRLH